MFEDSISCSPSNDKKTSRSRRFLKHTTRKSPRLSGATPAYRLVEDVPSLDALYEESEHSSATTITQYEHFNPFENEIILAAADKAEASTSKSKLNDFVSQGFVRLEELPIIEDTEAKHNFSSNPGEHQHAIHCPETQFGITESEFVRFCDEAEVNIDSQPTVGPATPQGRKSIVDAILEDFCGSPYSESPPKLTSDNATPIFRFKSKSLRTYSRIRRKKPQRSIVTELTNVIVREDDGNTSDSSGLSVQEDFSQNAVPQLDTVDLNNSIKVCENLLSLSSFFSQSTSHEKSPSMHEEKQKISLSAIVQDIIEIRRKAFTLSRSKSADEFYGFFDGDSEKNEDDTLKDLLEDEDDVLEQINCDSLCYERAIPMKSFTYNCSDIERTLEDVNAAIEGANKLISSIGDSYTEAGVLTTNSLPNCDKHDDVPQNRSQNPLLEEDQLFDDVDLWNDTDYLLNYKSQKPPSNLVKPNDSNRHLPSIESFSLKTETAGSIIGNQVIEVDSERNTFETNATTASCLVGFSTASRKPIAISKEAKRKANEILSKFEQAEAQQRLEGLDESLNETKTTVQELAQISNARELAMESVEGAFLAPIQGLVSASQTCDRAPSSSTFLGFSTASRKPIAISNEAQRKASEILTKFEEAEAEQRMGAELKRRDALKQDKNSNIRQPTAEESFGVGILGISSAGKKLADESTAPTFLGFLTASKKPITISNEGKRKADEILKTFEREEEETKMKQGQNADPAEFRHNNERNDVVSPMKPIGSSLVSAFAGFSTASRKHIAVSDEAKRKADEILNKFEQAEQEERKQLVRQSNEVSEDIEQKVQDMFMNTEFLEEAFAEEIQAMDTNSISESGGKNKQNVNATFQVSSSPKFEGFRTASKKSIKVSELAKQYADQLLKMDNDDLEADLKDSYSNSTNPVESALDKLEQVDGVLRNSAKLKNGERSLRTIGQSVSDKKVSTKSVEFSKLKKHYLETELEDAFDHTGTGLAELDKGTDSYSQEYEVTENHSVQKRKRSVPFSEDLRQSLELISPRRLSCSERTPLNRIENAILHKTLSMPQMKATPKSAIISRKNLLSLSKRRKFNSPIGAGPKTPEKANFPPTPHCNANETPNLKEFFNSVTTSTPRLNRHGITNRISKDSSIDTDFRQINWEEANNSARLARNSFASDLNVTCSEVSPSPKQRIERLKMYGEPPPISPISMANKCRPSGLRRTRSLMKP